MVVSPGREADGIMHMPTGQSGHPLSPFYANSHAAWAKGEPTPFLPGPSRLHADADTLGSLRVRLRSSDLRVRRHGSDLTVDDPNVQISSASRAAMTRSCASCTVLPDRREVAHLAAAAWHSSFRTGAA